MRFHTGPVCDERVITLEPKKNIGVLVSSGADSTTLLALLYKNFQDCNIRLFNVQTSEDPRKPKIENILKQLDINLELEIVGKKTWAWSMNAHYARLATAFVEIRDTTNCEELYCGNILPPHSQWFPRWDVHQPGIARRPWLTNDPFLKNPFEHLEKYHVIDLARRGKFDYIFEHTISCNVDANVPCGVCMGCRELEYGYYQLDKEQGMTLDQIYQEAIWKHGAIGW